MGEMIGSITPESAGAYIKRGLENDFVELARESKDKNFDVAHICMLYLAIHDIMCDKRVKITPKEAYEKAIETAASPNTDEIMVKTLVTQFSLRGEEFGNWVENPAKMETLWEIEKN